MYAGTAPWDIGRPQPQIIRLEKEGQIRGSVLDVGCGTGENAIFLASKGHETWGIDFVPVAIERAKAKAAERGAGVNFSVADALELAKIGRQFDTVIDCGLFHTFDDSERPTFVRGLATVVRPGGWLHILCFSDKEPGTWGPRRVSQQEIRDAFRSGWEIARIEATRFESHEIPDGPSFSPGGPHAWLASIERTAEK
jgi:ubiquinone/menaquinone biosynthesis C-methylase UbiE